MTDTDWASPLYTLFDVDLKNNGTCISIVYRPSFAISHSGSATGRANKLHNAFTCKYYMQKSLHRRRSVLLTHDFSVEPTSWQTCVVGQRSRRINLFEAVTITSSSN